MSRNFPDLGRHALGLREGQPQRRDEGVRRRGLPPRQGGGRGAPLLRGRPGLRAGETSTGSRRSCEAGHPVGNHTYDHVNVLATRPEDVQFRFQRAPWLIEGRAPAEVIRDNVRLATAAMKARLGIEPAGFRTPGGFADGLRDRPDVRAMLRDQGFGWVSSLYPPHEAPRPAEEPGADGLRQHRRGPGGGPAVRLPRRPGRGADEPDQRHRRLPHRPLAARLVPRRPSASASSGRSSTGPSSTSWGTRPASTSPTPSSARST